MSTARVRDKAAACELDRLFIYLPTGWRNHI